MPDRWIEWECPVTGVDFDEHIIVGPDDLLHCPDCGGEHKAGEVGQLLEIVEGVEGIGGSGGVRKLTTEQWRKL